MTHLARNFQRIRRRKSCIDEGYIRVRRTSYFEHFFSISRFSNYFTISHTLKGGADTLSEERLLINNNDTYRFHVIPFQEEVAARRPTATLPALFMMIVNACIKLLDQPYLV